MKFTEKACRAGVLVVPVIAVTRDIYIPILLQERIQMSMLILIQLALSSISKRLECFLMARVSHMSHFFVIGLRTLRLSVVNSH